jgi:hypothetical protein
MLRDVTGTLVADLTVLLDRSTVPGMTLASVTTLEGSVPADTGVAGAHIGTAPEIRSTLGDMEVARHAVGLDRADAPALRESVIRQHGIHGLHAQGLRKLFEPHGQLLLVTGA